jgi:TRAP-type C4-dicarboxylate transport system permease small subunit
MVFSIYFLNRPLGWIVEINEYIILYTAFLVAAFVLRQEGHVKMDIVAERFPLKVQLAINIITSIVSTVVCGIFTWFGAKVTWQLYLKKTLTATVLELPKYFFTIVIFLGSFLLVIQFIRRTYGFIETWRGLKDQGLNT